jgi:hypothetical protein
MLHLRWDDDTIAVTGLAIELERCANVKAEVRRLGCLA